MIVCVWYLCYWRRRVSFCFLFYILNLSNSFCCRWCGIGWCVSLLVISLLSSFHVDGGVGSSSSSFSQIFLVFVVPFIVVMLLGIHILWVYCCPTLTARLPTIYHYIKVVVAPFVVVVALGIHFLGVSCFHTGYSKAS